jgi:hypothetical protein
MKANHHAPMQKRVWKNGMLSRFADPVPKILNLEPGIPILAHGWADCAGCQRFFGVVLLLFSQSSGD